MGKAIEFVYDMMCRPFPIPAKELWVPYLVSSVFVLSPKVFFDEYSDDLGRAVKFRYLYLYFDPVKARYSDVRFIKQLFDYGFSGVYVMPAESIGDFKLGLPPRRSGRFRLPSVIVAEVAEERGHGMHAYGFFYHLRHVLANRTLQRVYRRSGLLVEIKLYSISRRDSVQKLINYVVDLLDSRSITKGGVRVSVRQVCDNDKVIDMGIRASSVTNNDAVKFLMDWGDEKDESTKVIKRKHITIYRDEW